MRKLFRQAVRRALRRSAENPAPLAVLVKGNAKAVRKVIDGRIINYETQDCSGAWMRKLWNKWRLTAIAGQRKGASAS